MSRRTVPPKAKNGRGEEFAIGDVVFEIAIRERFEIVEIRQRPQSPSSSVRLRAIHPRNNAWNDGWYDAWYFTKKKARKR